MTVNHQELQRLRDAIDARLASLDPSTSQNALSLSNSRPYSTPTLAMVDAKLYRVEREMDLLARVLEVAEKERDELHFARRRAQNSRAVIHRLPEEILREIFVRAGGHVGHTCHLWREITLNISWLWRDIHFTITPRSPISFEMASTWIQRSRLVPLNFMIVFCEGRHADLNAIMQFFTTHFLQCRSLTVTCDVQCLELFDWVFLLSVPMPHLQHLDLNASILVDEEHGSGQLVVPLASYPELCSLSVSIWTTDIVVSFGEFFSPYLTAITIDVGDICVSDLSRLIAASPALCSLTFISTTNGSRVIDDVGHVMTLPPSTVELTLIGERAARLIIKLEGQNVHTLSIDLRDLDQDEEILLPPLKVAFPNLRKYIHGSAFPLPQLPTIIRHPRLKELELDVHSFWRLVEGAWETFAAECQNLRSITAYSDSEHSSYMRHWIGAKEGAHYLLHHPALETMKIFFIRCDAWDPWPQDIVDLCRWFPDRFFVTLGPVLAPGTI